MITPPAYPNSHIQLKTLQIRRLLNGASCLMNLQICDRAADVSCASNFRVGSTADYSNTRELYVILANVSLLFLLYYYYYLFFRSI